MSCNEKQLVLWCFYFMITLTYYAFQVDYNMNTHFLALSIFVNKVSFRDKKSERKDKDQTHEKCVRFVS